MKLSISYILKGPGRLSTAVAKLSIIISISIPDNKLRQVAQGWGTEPEHGVHCAVCGVQWWSVKSEVWAGAVVNLTHPRVGTSRRQCEKQDDCCVLTWALGLEDSSPAGSIWRSSGGHLTVIWLAPVPTPQGLHSPLKGIPGPGQGTAHGAPST